MCPQTRICGRPIRPGVLQRAHLIPTRAYANRSEASGAAGGRLLVVALGALSLFAALNPR